MGWMEDLRQLQEQQNALQGGHYGDIGGGDQGWIPYTPPPQPPPASPQIQGGYSPSPVSQGRITNDSPALTTSLAQAQIGGQVAPWGQPSPSGRGDIPSSSPGDIPSSFYGVGRQTGGQTGDIGYGYGADGKPFIPWNDPRNPNYNAGAAAQDAIRQYESELAYAQSLPQGGGDIGYTPTFPGQAYAAAASQNYMQQLAPEIQSRIQSGQDPYEITQFIESAVRANPSLAGTSPAGVFMGNQMNPEALAVSGIARQFGLPGTSSRPNTHWMDIAVPLLFKSIGGAVGGPPGAAIASLMTSSFDENDLNTVLWDALVAAGSTYVGKGVLGGGWDLPAGELTNWTGLTGAGATAGAGAGGTAGAGAGTSNIADTVDWLGGYEGGFGGGMVSQPSLGYGGGIEGATAQDPYGLGNKSPYMGATKSLESGTRSMLTPQGYMNIPYETPSLYDKMLAGTPSATPTDFMSKVTKLASEPKFWLGAGLVGMSLGMMGGDKDVNINMPDIEMPEFNWPTEGGGGGGGGGGEGGYEDTMGDWKEYADYYKGMWGELKPDVSYLQGSQADLQKLMTEALNNYSPEQIQKMEGGIRDAMFKALDEMADKERAKIVEYANRYGINPAYRLSEIDREVIRQKEEISSSSALQRTLNLLGFQNQLRQLGLQTYGAAFDMMPFNYYSKLLYGLYPQMASSGLQSQQLGLQSQNQAFNQSFLPYQLQMQTYQNELNRAFQKSVLESQLSQNMNQSYYSGLGSLLGGLGLFL